MTLDTNIVIAYFNGETMVVEAIIGWRSEGRSLYLPTVVESEVLSFPNWSPQELAKAEQFLEENFRTVFFDRPVARMAATIRRNVRMKLPDAAIAATALYMQTPLVTRNIRDFKKVAGLEIVTF